MSLALPSGIRDLLPEEASTRRAIARKIMDRFAANGYEAVVVPPFEFSSVTDMGLGTLAQSDVLRFVEPESGEIASLRPDTTPQVARLVVTRLLSRPGPYRIACEGIVLRRKSGRARKHRQIAQVGTELLGLAGEDAELEQISLACDAVRDAGVTDFVLELSHAGIVRALLADAKEDARDRITDALARKDTARVTTAAAGHLHSEVLATLTRTFGAEAGLARAEKVTRGTPAEASVADLRQLFDRAAGAKLAPKVTCDPGAVRHFAYYTGARFTIFAEGPGEPLGGGGRYDALLEKFGAPMPAVGFALNLDHLAWAAAHGTGAARVRAASGVVLTHDVAHRAAEVRAAGMRAVVAANKEAALAYARAWGYSFVLTKDSVLKADGSRVADGTVSVATLTGSGSE